MIPSKLTIQGLYSYQKKVTIDFDALLNSKLFGIFGSVGSGKSTILEAISFSLYGETERLNKNEGRGYNMMNLKSDRLWIDFEFRAGSANNLYRITTEVERTRKRFEDTKPIKKSQYLYKEGDWEPVSLSQVHEALGLSYDNFRRTIIIPQGKFQEFLQLKNKDRTQMLKEIFHLHRFELFNQASTLSVRNREELQKIEGQLIQLGDISSEVLTEKENAVVKLKIENNALQNTINQLETKEKIQQKLKEECVALENLEQEFRQLNEQKEAFLEKEAVLKDYESCVITFKDLFNHQQKLVKDIAEIQHKINVKSSDYKVAVEKINELEKELAVLAQKREKRHENDQQIRDLATIVSIIKISKKELELKARVKKGKTFVESEEQKINQEKQKKVQLAETLLSQKKQLPGLDIISAINQWNTKDSYLKQQYNAAEKEVKQVNTELTSCLQEFNKTVKGYDVNFENVEVQLAKIQSEKNTALAKQRVKRESILLEVKLKDLVLADGDPCPLCGSLDHPQPFNGKHDNLALERVDSEIAKLDGELHNLRQLNTSVKLLLAQKKRLESEVQLKEKGLKKIKEENDVHLTHFLWSNWIENKGEIALKIAVWNQLSQSNEKLGETISSLDVALQKMEGNKLKYQQKVDQLQAELNEVFGEKKGLVGQLKHLNVSDFNGVDEEVVQEKMRTLQKEVDQLEVAFKTQEELIGKCKTRQGMIEGALKELQLGLEKLKKEESEAGDNIQNLLSKSKFSSLEEVVAILKIQINPADERKSIEKYHALVAGVGKQIIEKKKQIGANKFDAEAYVLLANELKAKKEEFGNGKGEEIKLLAEIVRLKKQVAEKNALEKEQQAREKRQENIKILSQLFKGSGFVNYVSSVYLKTLCNAANERFQKLTKQALKLEMSEDNQFYVRDYLNNGQLRNIKTLSGGQMFQASLSMSLALAQQVQELSTVKQNFFFLDEGFGSLDKEALQLVFDALKELRKENRVVGIISHVEELQQEIETYVKVQNHPETGSSLQFSWLT